MFLLDTNVVSELFRPHPDATMRRWWNNQFESDLWLSCITVQEIDFGLHIMPLGKRHDALRQAWQEVLTEDFDQRVLTFDTHTAHAAAQLMAKARSAGRVMDWPDAQIAGIAQHYDLTLVTRNMKDFEGLGQKLLNPWEVQV